ncbi:MAG: AraC family transcriptional regulator [Planctomycetota bacterium]
MRLLRHRIRDVLPSVRAIGVGVQCFTGYAADIRTGAAHHAHEVFYLSYIVRGRCYHDIGDQRFAEGPGSLAAVQWDVPHVIDTGGKPVSVYNLYLDPARHPLPTLPTELRGALAQLIPPTAAFANRRNRLLRCQFADPKPLAHRLEHMFAEQTAAKPGHLVMMEALLREVLVLIARQLQATGIRGPADVDAQLEGALSWMRDHLADNIGVEDIAHAADLSRFHCSRRLLAYTGRPPMAYLMDLRLQEAALQLRGGDEPVVDIAVACGFKDLGHFGRRFKAAFGLSPARYRAAAR